MESTNTRFLGNFNDQKIIDMVDEVAVYSEAVYGEKQNIVVRNKNKYHVITSTYFPGNMHFKSVVNDYEFNGDVDEFDDYYVASNINWWGIVNESLGEISSKLRKLHEKNAIAYWNWKKDTCKDGDKRASIDKILETLDAQANMER